MAKTIIIGTRSSRLALWQADYIARRLREKHPSLIVEEKRMTTKGDRILDAPLAKIGGKGLFTKELETAMLAGEIDIAVHSLKDMPTEVPEGLVITAITERYDPGDAVVSPRYQTLAALPPGARVGTSSLRRRAQLLAARPDLTLFDLRGNVNTRLEKLDAGEYDAVILAVAGLKRLGFGDRITEVLPRALCLPAVGQGALGIEARRGDHEVRNLVDFLRDEAMTDCAAAERAFLETVEGGCQVPVGVYAAVDGDQLSVEAVIASLDERQSFRDTRIGPRQEAKELGRELANVLLDAGGIEILHGIGLLLNRR